MTPNMRVLHVCHSTYPDTTGASIRSRYLAEAQARLGLAPSVLSSPFQPPADPTQAAGVEWLSDIPYYRCFDASYDHRFMVAKKSLTTRARKLTAIRSFTASVRRVAKERQVHVIHGHSLFFCGLAAVFAGRALGLPSIYEVRSLIEDTLVREGGASPHGVLYRTYRWFDRLATHLADHVVTLSAGLRNDLIERGVPMNRITVIPNGVDVTTQTPSLPPDATLRARLGFPDDVFLLGYIGTQFGYESLDVAIEAVDMLRTRHPQLHLLIVGGGNAHDDLVRQATKLGLSNRIRFVDRVSHEEIGKYYGLVDLFVLPRRPNRLTDLVTPLKPLEIMARAKPVLASDCGGHRELITHGENGFLYDARSVERMADGIAELFAMKAKLPAFGRQARAWVSSHRTWDDVVRPTLPLYEGLVAARGVEKSRPAPAARRLGSGELA